MNILRNIFTTAVIFMAVGMGQTSSSQTIELLAGNTLNGAMNGVILGGAVMGLQNSEDFAPARIGLGTGTLYGIGVGARDVMAAGNKQFHISGTFNDGTNSSIIVLLDTFYGVAGGAVIASAITLIANEPLATGLQYGSSAGAWAGFGFGLIDAFLLSKPNIQPRAGADPEERQNPVAGFVSYRSENERLSIGFLNPTIGSYISVGQDHFERNTIVNMQLLSLSVQL